MVIYMTIKDWKMFTYHRVINSEKEPLKKETDNGISKKFSKFKLIIVPFLFCLFIGEGIIAFVINEWTHNSVHQHYSNVESKMNSSACEDKNTTDPIYVAFKEIQQKTSLWLICYKIAEYVPTIFANSILPSYTDTFGRRFLFILGSLTMLIKSVIVTVTIRYNRSPAYIVFAYFIQGLSGTSFALFSVSFSYTADCTSPDKNRVLGIVAVEGVLVSTAIASGFLAGYLIETIGLGYFRTAVICTSFNLVAFIQGTILLPESLPLNNRSERKGFSTMIKRVTDFYVSKEFKGLRQCFLILLLSFAFAEITNVNRSTLETLFLLGQPFCWDPSKIGNFQLVREAIRGGVGLLSLHFLQKLMSNEVISIVSTLSNMGSFLLEGFANTKLKMYLVAVIGIFSFLVIPMLRGLMSSITSPDKQGSMFASIAVIQVISALVSALTQNSIYSATLSIMNGFVFLVMAGFCVIDCLLLITYCVIKPYNISQSKHEASNNNSCIFDKTSTQF